MQTNPAVEQNKNINKTQYVFDRDLISAVNHFPLLSHYTLCSKKSDAKIQITITMAYLIRIKCPLSGFNDHLSDVNFANFNKIHRSVYLR